MDKVIFTQLSELELREIIRDELKKVIYPKKETTTDQFPEILNIKLAAKFLNRSVSSLYKLTSQRLIPFHNPSGKLLIFKKSELINWIEQGRKPTTIEMNVMLNDKIRKQVRR